MRKTILILVGLLIGLSLFIFLFNRVAQPKFTSPLQISYIKSQNYPGSDLKIESTLPKGKNYKKYIASYYSDGLKIYGLLTIPDENKPENGFPAIIFNHGYITPELYTSDGNYIAYVNDLASAGYIIFKPDYRGNGKSQGQPNSEYFSRSYDIDNLNAIASIKKYTLVNPNKIGVWGHSLGGHITLMDLVVSNDIKAAVIWGGVVGSYNDIIYNWQNKVSYQPDKEDLYFRNLGRDDFLKKYGNPNKNKEFWDSIDPTQNLNLISSPVQIHIGSADNQVPPDFSKNLYKKLKDLGKNVEFYEYSGGDHNISQFFDEAMNKSILFFNKYLK